MRYTLVFRIAQSYRYPLQEDVKAFRKEHGDKVVNEVTVNKMYGGMRGIWGLVTGKEKRERKKGAMWARNPPLSPPENSPRIEYVDIPDG